MEFINGGDLMYHIQKEGRFKDTNQMFVKPDKFNYHVTSQDAKLWAPKIIEELIK